MHAQADITGVTAYERNSPRRPQSAKEQESRALHKQSEQRRRDESKLLLDELKSLVPQPGHENIKSKTNVGDIAKNELVNNSIAYILALRDKLAATHGEKSHFAEGLSEFVAELQGMQESADSAELDPGALLNWTLGRLHQLLVRLTVEDPGPFDRQTPLQLPELQSFSTASNSSTGPPTPNTEAAEFELPPNLRKFVESHPTAEQACLGGPQGVLARWEALVMARAGKPSVERRDLDQHASKRTRT